MRRLKTFSNHFHDEKLKQKLETKGELNKKVYLKKWTITKHAVLFKLSNKIVLKNLLESLDMDLPDELKALDNSSTDTQKLS